MRSAKVLLAAASAMLTASGANAAFTITYTQVDNDVRAVGTGSLNVTGLSRNRGFDSFGAIDPFIQPARTTQIIGSDGFMGYDITISGPAQPWGAGGQTNGVGTGGGVYFNNNGNDVFAILGVPINYVSGSALSNSALYANQTFVSMGITAGTYTYLFNSGVNADSISFVFDPVRVITPPLTPAVPEPATWAMMLVGFGMVAGAARYRRRSTVTTYA